MARKSPEPSPYYWSVDFVGLTQEQATRVAELVGEHLPELQGILVDPSEFLAINVDRDTAQAIHGALVRVRPKLSEGLLEDIATWLRDVAVRDIDA